MPRPLNHRQERFIHEYLKDQNASAAAVRAGYSARSKGTHAAALMKHPLIAERIDQALEDMYASLDITAFGLLRQQARVAFFDARKVFDKEGRPRRLDEMDEEVAAVLTVHVDERANGDFVRRLRQPSRAQALGALERRYAQFMELQLARARARREMEEEWEEVRKARRSRGPEAGRAPAVVLDLERPEVLRRLRGESAPAAQAQAPSARSGAAADVPAKAAPATIAPAVADALPVPATVAPGAMPASVAPPVSAPGAEGAASGAPVLTRALQARADAAPVLSEAQGPESIQGQLQRAGKGLLVLSRQKAREKAARAREEAARQKAREEQARREQEEARKEAEQKAAARAATASRDVVRRDDPDLLWGGRRPPTPEPEPNPVMLAQVANAKRVEQLAELEGEMARRGIVRPGPPPQKMEPGYNPPWLRRDRPRYAIGAGECSFDGYDEN